MKKVISVITISMLVVLMFAAIGFGEVAAPVSNVTSAPVAINAPAADASVAGAAIANAPAPAKVDSGDTAWMLISTALVMLMTPGLALFYGGMVRRKNVLGTLMHSFIILCLVSVIWIVWGYTLAFGTDKGGFIGTLEFLGLAGVAGGISTSIPTYVFMMFQGMFAVITPALITGAFAERMKFSALVLFTTLWVTIVYSPVAHWVWGNGWLMKFGALDFAGGTVVHINSAVAGIIGAILLGKRKGYLNEAMPPHNLTMTFIGGALLWFGWFGFNSGSALAANELAGLAFVTTNTGAAAAALAWSLVESLHRGKATVLGAVSGAVAGLVAITPGAGFVTPMAAIVIGGVAGILCYTACNLRPKLGYDDSLDVFGVHGIGGLWGAIATGIFASPAVNSLGTGLLYGNPKQVWIQIVACLATIAYSGVLSFILYKVVDMVVGLRVTEEEEVKGLDLSQHGENGYDM